MRAIRRRPVPFAILPPNAAYIYTHHFHLIHNHTKQFYEIYIFGPLGLFKRMIYFDTIIAAPIMLHEARGISGQPATDAVISGQRSVISDQFRA